jgi:hypothetical protein
VAAIPDLLQGSQLENRLAMAQPHDLPHILVPERPPQVPEPSGWPGSTTVAGRTAMLAAALQASKQSEGSMESDGQGGDDKALQAAYLRQVGCMHPHS